MALHLLSATIGQGAIKGEQISGQSKLFSSILNHKPIASWL